MSQLIVTSRYLKNGNQKNKTKRRNYTKYIATRETVEIRSQKFVDRNANATKNQKQLVNDLINALQIIVKNIVCKCRTYLIYTRLCQESLLWIC